MTIRSKHSLLVLLALLGLAAPLPLAEAATCDVVVNTTGHGPWTYYLLGSPSETYQATWTTTQVHDDASGTCRPYSMSCSISVSDGSTYEASFYYFGVGGSYGESWSGLYQGTIPLTGDRVACYYSVVAIGISGSGVCDTWCGTASCPNPSYYVCRG